MKRVVNEGRDLCQRMSATPNGLSLDTQMMLGKMMSSIFGSSFPIGVADALKDCAGHSQRQVYSHTEMRIRNSYSDQTHCQKSASRPTLGDHLIKANEYLRQMCREEWSSMTILEVCAGNGLASGILLQGIDYERIIKTDLFPPDPVVQSVAGLSPIEKLASEEAVRKYRDAKVLLLISPPPMCTADYLAIREFEGDVIIYVGELGASDGSEGMYRYLMDHPIFALTHEFLIYRAIDPFGGNCDKKLYIFQREHHRCESGLPSPTCALPDPSSGLRPRETDDVPTPHRLSETSPSGMGLSLNNSAQTVASYASRDETLHRDFALHMMRLSLGTGKTCSAALIGEAYKNKIGKEDSAESDDSDSDEDDSECDAN